MMAALYKTKKELKQSIGKEFRYRETSLFGSEYKTGQILVVVGPSEYERRWYAQVWLNEDGTIRRVK